ncbi:MAG: M16 family metallopeptidase [Sphingomonadaceae bacterium]
MPPVLSRVLRLALLLALVPSVAIAAPEGVKRGAPVAKVAVPAAVPWLYKGSDVPVDTAWTFGELPNGLRYAVRRNGVPPRQVSIRLAIDAGSLMERDGEEGFAHFNEHMSFRGSKFVADEEAKRVWQRLGATFGSDTNAFTSPTQTVYKLDLPSATPQGLDESVKILSGMMAGAFLTPEAVDGERRTILAELREGTSPQQRLGDATRSVLFAGQPLATRSPIGTVASLNAATPATLKAFRDRWYRPERTVVVIVGDTDPTVLENLIQKYFAEWKGEGPPAPDADFGKPRPDAPRTKVLVEPALPPLISMAVVRPWFQKNDTIEYNRGKLIDSLAARVINRRLETRARAGGSFLQASISQDDISRSVDGTFIQIVPLGDDWRAAIRDVRAVIASALGTPSSQADIDREATEFTASLQVAVDSQATESGGELADSIVEAVNIRETVASAEVARDVFTVMQDRLTPAAILASTRRLLSGMPMRAVLALPTADPAAEAALLTALTEDVKPDTGTANVTPVSFDRVPKFGPPGTVVRRAPVQRMGLEFVELSNGVRLSLFLNKAEEGKVMVSVRFGRGWQALPANRKTVAWAAEPALVASGIGDLGQEELDRLTSARRINMGFDIADDAFVLKAVTRPSDFEDQMRLLAAKLDKPGWDPAPVNRARAATIAGLTTLEGSPSAVLGRDLQQLLRGGDTRWATPTREEADALTPAAFRALWEPLLATGPIEVSIFGDIEADKAIAIAAATFGAMPARSDAKPISPEVKPLRPSRKPLVRTHRGAADQAAAVLAWPTSGGYKAITESRRLEVLAAIFSDRLFDQLREGEGVSYSPNVSNQWPEAFKRGGSLIVISQLPPDKTDRFFAIARGIAADLVAKPVSADEFTRAVGPLRQAITRASSGNTFWLSQLGGATRDPRKIAALATLSEDYRKITIADLQATAKRWLKPRKSFSMIVVPEKR